MQKIYDLVIVGANLNSFICCAELLENALIKNVLILEKKKTIFN